MAAIIFTMDDDPSLQVTVNPGNGGLNFTANDEWCGDSETGFGALVTVTLHVGEVMELSESLRAWLATQPLPIEVTNTGRELLGGKS